MKYNELKESMYSQFSEDPFNWFEWIRTLLRTEAFHVISGKIPEISRDDVDSFYDFGWLDSKCHMLSAVPALLNRRACDTYFERELYHEKPVSLGLIKNLHLLLSEGLDMPNIPIAARAGSFRENLYVEIVSENIAPSLEAHECEGIEAHEIIPALNEMIAQLAHPLYDPFTTAVYLMARFMEVRPFAHSNGLVAWYLMNYYLITNGELPVSIPHWKQDRWRELLDSYFDDGNIKPLCRFMKKCAARTWEATLNSSDE